MSLICLGSCGSLSNVLRHKARCGQKKKTIHDIIIIRPRACPKKRFRERKKKHTVCFPLNTLFFTIIIIITIIIVVIVIIIIIYSS